MQKIDWQNGTVVKDAFVTINGTEYTVTPKQMEGTTPLSADNLNLMQNNIEDAIDEATADTGWVKINTSVSNNIYYRQIGKLVYIKGSVTHSSSTQTITLPFTINNNYVFLLGGSGNYYTKCFTNEGTANLYIATGTGTTSTTYNLNISFFID